MQQERRLMPRYAFSAVAKVIDNSGGVIRARVSDISLSGCRLHADQCLRVGAEVSVTIDAESDHFQTWAMVVHSTASDMGLVFHSTNSMFMAVLRRWVSAARSAASVLRESK